MRQNRKISAAPPITPCLACGKPTRRDGYCRTKGCPNRVPESIIAPAREQALADMRDLLAHSSTRRGTTMDPIIWADSPEDVDERGKR